MNEPLEKKIQIETNDSWGKKSHVKKIELLHGIMNHLMNNVKMNHLGREKNYVFFLHS